jgi:molecular chaperone GrpE (heat shock protein)
MDKHSKLHSVHSETKAPEKSYSADDFKQLVEQNNQLLNKLKLLENELEELSIKNLESQKWSSQLKSLKNELNHYRKHHQKAASSKKDSEKSNFNLNHTNMSRFQKHYRKFCSGPISYFRYAIRKVKKRLVG